MYENYVVIGQDNCKWCERVKFLLDAHQISFTYIIADGNLKEFLKASGLKTVPQVYRDGDLLGDYETMRLLLENSDDTPD
ncbi:GRX_family domain containing protein [uncultured Caudovirales phage]|uniref:GRX_family domain containing protein n=1 Tax=uncultured Caudovirales phage TaxID=2100421 RepID=A0A6J5KXC3_9CAUD|nr:GRX_family domain containing protein [uncultured Caudovirales phage]